MKHNYLLGFFMAFIFALGEMGAALGTNLCFRGDIRPVIVPLLSSLVAFRWIAGLLACAILGLAVLNAIKNSEDLPRLWLPLCAVLWLMLWHGQGLLIWTLALWVVYVGLKFRRDGASWDGIVSILAASVLLEFALRGATGPLPDFFIDYCYPDPFRAFLLTACCGGALFAFIWSIQQKRKALLVLTLFLVAPVILWQPPKAPHLPEGQFAKNWESPHASFRKDTKIVFAPIKAKPEMQLDSLQALAIANGDSELHRALWEAVLSTEPLSLKASTEEIAGEILLRPDLPGLESYLTLDEKAEEAARSRATFRGRIRNASWPASGLKVRVVQSQDSNGKLNRTKQPSKVMDKMWLYRGEGDGLLSSSRSAVQTTDSDGGFEFSNLPWGSYSLLVGVGERDELSSAAGWMPFTLYVDRDELLELGYSPLWEEPRNLDFRAPLQEAWGARFADDLVEGVVHDAVAGEVKLVAGEDDSYSGISQRVDARQLRGKTVRFRLRVLEVGREVGFDSEPKVGLHLRTSNRSFKDANIGAGETRPAEVEAVYLIPEDAEYLSISCFMIGVSEAVFGGLEYEVLDD